MGKNNQSEVNRQKADRKNQYALHKVKKGVASVLVGASLLGVGLSVVPGLSGMENDTLSIEAAEVGAQIVAFDHYVLEGQPYNLSANVNAFEIIDGDMVDLTGDVDVIATNILDDRTQEITYSVVGSDGIAKTTTATITYGKDYASALKSVENAFGILQGEIADLGKEADGVKTQFDGINKQLDAVRADYADYLEYAAEQDADIAEVNARADAIEKNITTIMQAITYSLADVAEISQQVEDNYAFITGEIERLETELTDFRDNVDTRVDAIEAELPEKATQEEVVAVQERVDTFLETSGAIEKSLSDQLTALNALYEDVVSGSMKRDEAMLEMLSIQEDRLDALRETLDTVASSSDEKIKALEAEIATKADPAEIEALEAELATLKGDADVREAAFTSQIEAAEAVNALLKERITGYEDLISEMEKELERLANEMAVLERILEALEQGDGNGGVIDPDDGTITPVDPDDEIGDIEVPGTDPVPDVDPDVDPVPDVDPDVDPVPDVDPEADPIPDVDPEADPIPDADPETEPFPDDNPDVDPIPEVDSDGDPIPVVDPEIEDGQPNPEPGSTTPVPLPVVDGDVEVDHIDPIPDDTDADAGGTDAFLGEDVTVGGDDVTAGGDTAVSPDTPVSSDDAATPSATDAANTDAGGAETQATGGGENAAPTAESAKAAALPQTGAGFGALIGTGIAGVSAAGAGLIKFFRKRG